MGSWKILDDSASFMDLELDYGFKVHQMPGLGMAPVENISTPFGLLDGALFQRTRTDVRRFSLNGWIQGATVPDLLSKRKALVELLRPDRKSPQEPVVLQFSGGTTTVQGSAFYDGGMELGEISNNTELDVSIQFVQYNPYWENSTAAGASRTSVDLSMSGSLSACTFLTRIGGQWAACTTDLPAEDIMTKIVADKAANIYAILEASPFTLSPDTAAWSHLTGGEETINDIIIGPDTDEVYFVGDFLTQNNGAVAASRVAKWTPSSSTWSALTGANGTGACGEVNKGIFSQGNLYIGGTFFQAGGNGSNLSMVAGWDGAEWVQLGACGALNGNDGINTGPAASTPGQEITSMAIAPNLDDIYFSGCFGVVSGSAASRLARFNISTGCWFSVPLPDATSTPGQLAFGQDGILYATEGDVTAVLGGACLLRFNGTTWSNDIANPVERFSIDSLSVVRAEIPNSLGVFPDSDGNVFYHGLFSSLVNSNPFSFGGGGLAKWNGSRWEVIDARIGFDTQLGNMQVDSFVSASGNFYMTHILDGELSSSEKPIQTSGFTTITNNGTSTAFPTIKLKSTGGTGARLRFIRNETTGEALLFDYGLSNNEILEIDLSPGKKTITSSFKGNVLGTALEPGSLLATWAIVPGANNVTVWVEQSGSPVLSGCMLFAEKYWGIDSGT